MTATTQFTGPGTGLSGTASALSIGGSAASATNATYAGTAGYCSGNTAGSAGSAGSATNAGYAGYAGSAGSATNAGYAGYADTANTFYAGVNYWHNSRDGYNRFYFGSANHTYFKSPGNFYWRSGNNDSDRMYFDSSANMGVSGDITAYWSDRRLKKEFEQVTDYEQILDGLTAYRFKWNELGEQISHGSVKNDDQDIGLIAQDVQAVLPNAVAVNLTCKDSTKPLDEQEDYYTIKYNKLTPVVIEAVKQLLNRTKTLECEIKQLKKKLGIE